MSEGRRLLAWGLGAFACASGLLLALAPWVSPRGKDDPGFAVTQAAQAQDDGWSRVTLDVSSAEAWRGFSFELGRQVPAGPAADLYLRRFQLRAPAGARKLPDGAWTSEGVLSDWYRYSYLSHRLVSRGTEYAVRLAAGDGAAAVRVVSYYCAGGKPGCLTLRYRLAPPSQANR